MKCRIYILLAILLWGCSFSREMQSQSSPTHVDAEEAKSETLISVRGKIDYSGDIDFLRYENGDFKLMSYSYYAKDKEISCRFNYNKTCEDTSGGFWYTASEFQKKEVLKTYLSRISEDFMEISNERKIQVLDSFIHVHKKSEDDYYILNKKEGEKLNSIFWNKTNGFDFIGKKVGFVESHGKPGGKGYYLYKAQKTTSSDLLRNSSLYLFNDQQKIETGGYEAAIVFRRTEHIPIEDVIETLKHD